MKIWSGSLPISFARATGDHRLLFGCNVTAPHEAARLVIISQTGSEMMKAKWCFLALVMASSSNCQINSSGLAIANDPGMGSGGESGTGGMRDAGSAPAGTGGQGFGGTTGSGGMTAPAGAGSGGSPNPDSVIDNPVPPTSDTSLNSLPDAPKDVSVEDVSVEDVSVEDVSVDRRRGDSSTGPGDARNREGDLVGDGGTPMTLIWSDEFEGSANTGVDATKWSYVTWDPGQVNNEAQKYTSRLQNVFQDGSGHLVLRGLNTPYAGNMYTSGRIESNGHFSFKFGRVEVSAKLPAGIGSFPGIIALGTSGTWPQCGELALVEQYGQDKSWFYTSANAGTAVGSGSTGNVKYTFPNATTASNDFHVYSLDWYSDHIVFQVDGIEITRTTFATSSPFYTVPEYLVLDLALGGNMGGIIDSSAFPMDMVVDYVRVYSF
jgi:hypothetical protein